MRSQLKVLAERQGSSPVPGLPSSRSAQSLMQTMLRFVDPALEARFQKDGYVTVQLFSADEADVLRERFAELQSGRTLSGNVPDGSFYTTVFERDEEFKEANDAVVREAATSRISRILDNAQMLAASFHTKVPGAPEVLLHQHPPFTDQPFERSLWCWCALDDCGAEAGTLRVVPGSHHLYRYLRTVDRTDFFADYRQELSETLAIPVPLRKGEAILFENSLIHGSAPNRSAAARPVVNSLWAGKGARQVVYREDGTGRVQIIDGDFTKVTGDKLVEKGLDGVAGEVLRTLPGWSRHASFDEVRLLLAAKRRATETFDPLEALDRERPLPPPPPQPRSRPRLGLRSAARLLPAGIRTRLRRRFGGTTAR